MSLEDRARSIIGAKAPRLAVLLRRNNYPLDPAKDHADDLEVMREVLATIEDVAADSYRNAAADIRARAAALTLADVPKTVPTQARPYALQGAQWAAERAALALDAREAAARAKAAAIRS